MSAEKTPRIIGEEQGKARRMPIAVAFGDTSHDAKAEPEAAAGPGAAPKAPRAPRAEKAARVRITEDVFAAPAAPDAAVTPPVARRFPFGSLFLAALSGLLSLWLGAAVYDFIGGLFATRPELGWLAALLAALAVAALGGFILREMSGLARLEANAGLTRRIADAHDRRDVAEARAAMRDIMRLGTRLPATAAARARLSATSMEFMDARDMIELTEREMMAPLDAAARKQVVDAAKRVSVVTAVSPRAFVDVGYVLFENARLIRGVAEIYGCRPGALGFLRLARATLAHLAVTGVVAMGDSLVQQIVGHGLAARVSARLGEGVLNGVMTARIGFAAMDVARPMPPIALERPTAAAVLSELSPLARAAEIDKR